MTLTQCVALWPDLEQQWDDLFLGTESLPPPSTYTAHIFIVTQSAQAALGGGRKAEWIYLWASHRCPSVEAFFSSHIVSPSPVHFVTAKVSMLACLRRRMKKMIFSAAQQETRNLQGHFSQQLGSRICCPQHMKRITWLLKTSMLAEASSLDWCPISPRTGVCFL